MTALNKIHWVIISVTNLLLISKMISIAWMGNDKAIIVIIFGYPLLTVLNGLIWLILRLFKIPSFKIYKFNTIGLLILFFPSIGVSMMY